MIVADLSPSQIRKRLGGPGLRLRTGPVVTRIQSHLAAIADGIQLHYHQHPLEADSGFVDFHVAIDHPPGLRRWYRPQAVFHFDGFPPFRPLPADQAFPMMEWGLNWCISAHCQHYLIIHAAVVERHGRALILPAPPGSGKSTLCAGLANRGWRLLSDELTIIDPHTGGIVPIPRPVSLKNASIGVIRAFAPDAAFGPVVNETVKGSVAHMQPSAESVQRAAEPAMPRWLVLPRFIPGADARLAPVSRARGLLHIADNAFNYHVHGGAGFRTLGRLIDGCDCFEFSYSRLDEAVRIFDQLADQA